MGSIYCLFSTENGVPRYVGQEQSGGDRYWQHIRLAKKGDPSPVHRWMRSVYLRGYDVGYFVLLRMGSRPWLSFRERDWIQSLPGLTNIRHNRSSVYHDIEISNRIAKKCRKQNEHLIYNYEGFHGLCYHKNHDAFTVRVCSGHEDGRCHIIQVEGDELPGRYDDTWSYWFKDTASAIDARDTVRGTYTYCKWPPDEVDEESRDDFVTEDNLLCPWKP